MMTVGVKNLEMTKKRPFRRRVFERRTGIEPATISLEG